MQADDPTARLRAMLEDELGEIAYLASLPATAIEEVAARLTRALAPHLAQNPATHLIWTGKA